MSLWDTEAPEECRGCSGPGNSGGTESWANSHSGPGPVCLCRPEEQTQAGRSPSDAKSWPVSTLGLSTLVGGHTGCQLRPMLEVPPGDESSSVPQSTWSQASRGLRPTRRGALPAVVYAPWGRSLLRGQLPGPLLWLRHSSSLSAFEFQSKPEADCKQMDGVIKSPKQGAKRLVVIKRSSFGSMIPAPMLGSCLCEPLLILCCKQTNHASFSPIQILLVFKAQTSPRVPRQPSVTSFPRTYTSPPTWLPDYSTFELLGLWLPTPLHRDLPHTWLAAFLH